MLQKDSQCVQFYEYNIGKSSIFFVIIMNFPLFIVLITTYTNFASSYENTSATVWRNVFNHMTPTVSQSRTEVVIYLLHYGNLVLLLYVLIMKYI